MFYKKRAKMVLNKEYNSSRAAIRPDEVLKRFWIDQGVKPGDCEDLEEKMRILSSMVNILDFPYEERKPALFELEKQYLIDKGYNI